MANLFCFHLCRRSHLFCCISAVLLLFPILLLLHTAGCLVESSASSFLSSPHFVLCDLLCSFRLERLLPSSRVPPWDVSRVLAFLRGPAFEPLSSCSLWDFTRKVLFVVSLTTARRVGELLAVSAEVSSSGEDLFLIFLSFGRRRSPLFTLCLALSPFALSPSALCGILLGISLRNFCSVLFGLSVFTFLVWLLFLHVLVLFLSHLMLLLILFPRMPSVFSSGMLLRVRILRQACLFLLYPCLSSSRPRASLRAQGFVGWLLPGLFSVILL